MGCTCILRAPMECHNSEGIRYMHPWGAHRGSQQPRDKYIHFSCARTITYSHRIKCVHPWRAHGISRHPWAPHSVTTNFSTLATYRVNTACMRSIVTTQCARNSFGELGRLVGRPTMDDTNGCAGTDSVDVPCDWLVSQPADRLNSALQFGSVHRASGKRDDVKTY